MTPSTRTMPSGDSVGDVLAAAEATIARAGPSLRIERKWATDWRAGRDLIVACRAFSHHVGMEFWRGSALPDPDHLLQGTGKNLRHVKVRSIAEARAPALARLIGAAIRLDASERKRTR